MPGQKDVLDDRCAAGAPVPSVTRRFAKSSPEMSHQQSVFAGLGKTMWLSLIGTKFSFALAIALRLFASWESPADRPYDPRQPMPLPLNAHRGRRLRSFDSSTFGSPVS
jgi:hypothetical protein